MPESMSEPRDAREVIAEELHNIARTEQSQHWWESRDEDYLAVVHENADVILLALQAAGWRLVKDRKLPPGWDTTELMLR